MVTELCLPILCVIKAITHFRRLFDHQNPDSSTNSNRTVCTSSQMCKKGSLRSVCHSSIQFSFKIKNWKLMSIFDTKVPNRKFFTFFPFDRILKHNLFSTLILSTIKRKMKLSPLPMARSVSLLKTFEGSESLTISAVFYDVLERLPQFFPLQRAARLWTLAKKILDLILEHIGAGDVPMSTFQTPYCKTWLEWRWGRRRG